MRFTLPTVAAGLALSAAVLAPTAAGERHHQRDHHHRAPARVKSHVALHLSGHSVLTGEALNVRGKVNPGGGRRVRVVFRGPETGSLVTHTTASGAFHLTWTPAATGAYHVRAYGSHRPGARAATSDARELTSFRLAVASYYGEGLYGNGVACGGTLTPDTLGVANKTLPCGTKVKLRYQGRSITVPVIDRGPYIPGRDYDLTEATKERLGFPGVGTVLADH